MRAPQVFGAAVDAARWVYRRSGVSGFMARWDSKSRDEEDNRG